jgi:DNA-binding MarR family transcriptional regulator
MEIDMETIAISKQLMRLNHLMHRYTTQSKASRDIERITGSNGWIIGYLSHNENRDVYQKDIEKEFSITRSTVSKVVNLMEQKEIIRRVSVEGDARLKKLVLTEKGHYLDKEMKEIFYSLESDLKEHLTDDKIQLFSECVETMIKNLEKIEGSADR